MIMTHTESTAEKATLEIHSRGLLPARGTYHVQCLHDQEAVARHLEQHDTDYIVIGAIMPARSGREMCRLLQDPDGPMQYPILMLAADSTATVPARKTGAWPDHARLLRMESRDTETCLRLGDLEIKPAYHEARVAGELIDLTTTEFKLLRLLTDHPGLVRSREHILDVLRGRKRACTSRSVDVLIVSLRRKLRSVGKRIRTVRGAGYRFSEA